MVASPTADDIAARVTPRLLTFSNATRLVAPCWSVVRLLSRGVATAKRFQNRAKRCAFGCNLGNDSIEHFTHCPVLVGGVTRFLRPLAHGQGFLFGPLLNWQTILLAIPDAMEEGQAATAALLADGIIAAHSRARHYGCPDGERSVQRSILARMRTLRLLAPKVGYYLTGQAPARGKPAKKPAKDNTSYCSTCGLHFSAPMASTPCCATETTPKNVTRLSNPPVEEGCWKSTDHTTFRIVRGVVSARRFDRHNGRCMKVGITFSRSSTGFLMRRSIASVKNFSARFENRWAIHWNDGGTWTRIAWG